MDAILTEREIAACLSALAELTRPRFAKANRTPPKPGNRPAANPPKQKPRQPGPYRPRPINDKPPAPGEKRGVRSQRRPDHSARLLRVPRADWSQPINDTPPAPNEKRQVRTQRGPGPIARLMRFNRTFWLQRARIR